MDFTKLDNLISELLIKISTYQDGYIRTHSDYFQGLKTHKAIPGQDTAPDNLDVKAGGQPACWRDTAIIDKNLPFTVEIHTYNSGNGKGWQAIFQTIFNGEKYTKSCGYGPEAEIRTYEWQKTFNRITL